MPFPFCVETSFLMFRDLREDSCRKCDLHVIVISCNHFVTFVDMHDIFHVPIFSSTHPFINQIYVSKFNLKKKVKSKCKKFLIK